MKFGRVDIFMLENQQVSKYLMFIPRLGLFGVVENLGKDVGNKGKIILKEEVFPYKMMHA